MHRQYPFPDGHGLAVTSGTLLATSTALAPSLARSRAAKAAQHQADGFVRLHALRIIRSSTFSLISLSRLT